MNKALSLTSFAIFGVLISTALPAGAQGMMEMGHLYGGAAGVGGGLGASMAHIYGATTKSLGATVGTMNAVSASQMGTLRPWQAQKFQEKTNAMFKEATAAEKSGKIAESAKLYQQLAQYREAMLGRTDMGAGQMYLHAAYLATKDKDFGTAEAAYQSALAIQQRSDPGSPKAAPILKRLADTICAEGKPASSTTYYQQALQLEERASGAASPKAMCVRSDLADAYVKAGNPSSAEPLIQKSIEYAEKDATVNKNDLSSMYESYASVLKQNNKTSQAEEVARKIEALKGAPAAPTTPTEPPSQKKDESSGSDQH